MDRLGMERGFGSGFFVSADGKVVTNHHVVEDAYAANVMTSEGTRLVVQGLLALDIDADLAVLKVNGKGAAHLVLAARGSAPVVGSRAYAIGNPEGFANTLSEGLVSGKRRVAADLFLLQTTAPISPGSSGGPLLDESGRVIGVTTLSLSRVAPGSQNLNFAVPAEKVWSLLGRAARASPVPLNRMPKQP
jgi:S1-C subfamily serine protease